MSKSPKKKGAAEDAKGAKSPAPAVKASDAADPKEVADAKEKPKKKKAPKDKAEAAEDAEPVAEEGKKKKKSKSKAADGEPAEDAKEGKKKSKSKKTKPVEEEDGEAGEEVVEEKKKKKKRSKSAPEPEAADEDAADEEVEIDLSSKKKKKKSKSKPVEDDDEEIGEPILDDPEEESKEEKEEKEDVADEDIELELDLKNKKKKKKKATDGAEESGAAPVKKAADGVVPWADSDRDYNYTELLERVFTLLRENNPSLAQRKKHSMAPPQMVRVGTKKSMWTNFQLICATMHRNEEHVQSFVVAETGTESSIDGSHRLVMKGKYTPKQVESLLRKYITEYVMCSICRNPETTLTRDSVTRLYFIQCESCGSRRSVAPIKSGFHAQNKADRKKIKEAS